MSVIREHYTSKTTAQHRINLVQPCAQRSVKRECINIPVFMYYLNLLIKILEFAQLDFSYLLF